MKHKFLHSFATHNKATALNLIVMLVSVFATNTAFGAAKSSAASGNWSDAATWQPVGVPDAADHVTIKGGHTVTIDGNYSCVNLSVGNATMAATTLQITTAGKSLTVTGTFSLNPNNRAYVYTLNAGPGQININGSSASWSTSGTNRYLVST
ncbi:MAG: hypothetical protein V4615_13145, partial [Bacteroidota bacterium]